ncbi:MAG: hypothetical protein IT377_10425 [Polyangiaceae bacterium]|nr:hypothetical protein [Polyangiaceae bacterium]
MGSVASNAALSLPRRAGLGQPAGVVASGTQRLRRFLRRASPRAAALVGALVAVPSCFLGLCLDDHWIAAHAHDAARFRPALRPMWDLFSFYTADSSTRFLRDLGVAPWWTDTEVRIRFFRPLASTTHWLDAQLGGSALVQHAQSLVWYALLVGVVAAVLRSVAKSRLAAVTGSLIFALAAGHSLPATWISNRNAVVSSVCAVVAIGLYVAAVRRGRQALLAAGAFAVALGGGEMALGAAGFFLAAELTLARDEFRRRALRLLPQALVFAVWAAAYRGLGYGVRGSGMYLDPGADPLGYLLALPTRFAALTGSALTGVPPETFSALPPGQQPLAAVLFLALALAVAWLFREALAKSASARFFLLSLGFATLPACGTLPAGRLLVLASVAAAGLLGEGLVLASRPGRSRASRVACGLLAVMHGPLAAVAFVGSTFALDAVEQRLGVASADLDALGLQGSSCVVFVHAPMLVNGYLLAQRESRGLPSPRFTLNLSSTDRPVRIQRVGAAALSVEARDGFYGAGDIGLLTRSLERPYSIDTRIEHPCGALTVEAVTADGVPTRVRFDATTDQLPLVEWADGRLVRVPWPAENQRFERAGGSRI